MQHFEDEIREQPPKKKGKQPKAAAAAQGTQRAAPSMGSAAAGDAASLRNRVTSQRS
jgi:chemotaxis protein MotA